MNAERPQALSETSPFKIKTAEFLNRKIAGNQSADDFRSYCCDGLRIWRECIEERLMSAGRVDEAAQFEAHIKDRWAVKRQPTRGGESPWYFNGSSTVPAFVDSDGKRHRVGSNVFRKVMRVRIDGRWLADQSVAAAVVLNWKNPAGEKREKLKDKYTEYDKKYLWLVREGINQDELELEKENGYLRYICLRQTAQAARQMAVAEIRQRVEGISDPNSFRQTSPEMLGRPLLQIKTYTGHLLGFARRVDEAADKLAEEKGFNERQKELLADLAFINRGRLPQEKKEFSCLARPLLKLVIEGRWEEAYVVRDFLLDNFPTMFAGWRPVDPEAGYGSARDFVQENLTGEGGRPIPIVIYDSLKENSRLWKEAKAKKIPKKRVDLAEILPEFDGSSGFKNELLKRALIIACLDCLPEKNIYYTVQGKDRRLPETREINVPHPLYLPILLTDKKGMTPENTDCAVFKIVEGRDQEVIFVQRKKGSLAAQDSSYGSMPLLPLMLRMWEAGKLKADHLKDALSRMIQTDNPEEWRGVRLSDLMEKGMEKRIPADENHARNLRSLAGLADDLRQDDLVIG